jgi:hypothetical protein
VLLLTGALATEELTDLSLQRGLQQQLSAEPVDLLHSPSQVEE